MTASTKLRRFRAVGDLFARPGKRKQAANQTAQPELQPEDHLRLYLARDTARKAFSLLLSNIRKENPHHHDRIVRDLETTQWSALTGYVVQMAFFESIRPPVRPLALPSRVADWLLALPDNSLGYHPEDLCWECGYARQYFDRSRSRVVEVTTGLSDAQWRFKPAPDRWSIAEILEHMVIVHERVIGRVREQLPQEPAPPERDYHKLDAVVIEKIPRPLDQRQGSGFHPANGPMDSAGGSRSAVQGLRAAQRFCGINAGSA
ncbi:MAG TPA: DinB family protein [Blastocatellia bacterium]|nr:DinB family protein [Blastocatellia bacterium]